MRQFDPSRFPLVLAACAMLLVGAAGTTAQPGPRGEELALKVAEAWTSQDVGIVDEVFSEDGVYEDVTAGTERKGREGIKVGFEVTYSAVPDFEVQLTKIFTTGSMVACEWVMTGTHTGDYPGLPATGKSFSVRGPRLPRCEMARSSAGPTTTMGSRSCTNWA